VLEAKTRAEEGRGQTFSKRGQTFRKAAAKPKHLKTVELNIAVNSSNIGGH